MRYNKGDLESTSQAAIDGTKSDGRLRYVFATAFGYQISKRKPDIRQDFFCFAPSTWALAHFDLNTGRHVWTDPKPYQQA